MKRQTLSAIAPMIALASLSLSSCSTDQGDHDAGSDVNQATSTAGSPEAFEFGGLWAKRAVFTSESSALGITAKSTVIRYNLMEATVNGQKLNVTEKTCEVETISQGASSISFSERLVKSLQTNSYTYDLPSALTPGAPVSMKGAVELLGLRLTDPANDPITQEAAFDLDNDGNPGISVDVSARVVFTVKGQIYTAQRTKWNEYGTFDGDKISGKIEWSVDQKTLGGNNPIFTSVTPTITTLPSESSFLMFKLPEGSTCATVMGEKGRKFPKL